jgi:hypothetical protein
VITLLLELAPHNGTTGKINASLDFDGTDDYIQVDDTSELEPTKEITLSAWINADDLEKYAGDNGKQQAIIRKTSNYILYVYDDTTSQNNIDFYLYGPNTRLSYATSNLSNNTWYHLVATYDGSDMRLYVDGKEVNSTSTSGDVSTSANHLGIGRAIGAADSFFDGQIDEVKVFGYALTQHQVRSLHNEGAVRFNE